MIPVDNIVFMKDNFPLLWDAYRETEAKQDSSLAVVEPSRTEGFPTIGINKEGRCYYLHSRYDPLKETQAIVNNVDVQDYEHVIFYGLGLGYHIQAFLNKYPHMSFSIYEPVPEVFNAFMSHFDLSNLDRHRLLHMAVEISEHDPRAFLEQTITQVRKNILFVELPSYKNIFSPQYNSFIKLFTQMVTNRRHSLVTDFAFEKRWIINSLLNFKYVLETPNILAEKADSFQGIPAIIVSAGPSLDYELENLRYIKENDLAYIFSVGSAVNSLLATGIHPHAQCTYDPGADNRRAVFARITEESITEIPLIFGSSVGFEVLRDYPGNKKFHMITSQDTISAFFLKLDDETQLDGVTDAPSIAVVTLQLLHKLGFNPIILVGQNLAYVDNRHYADGIAYADEIKVNTTGDGLIKIKDVEGNDIFTNSGFNQMRLNMEHYINHMDGVRILNTTRGGASIKGTEVKYLNQILEENVLNAPVVDPHWYDMPVTGYDHNYFVKRYRILKKDYEILEPHLQAVLNILNEINALKEKRDYKQLEQCWPRLDKAYGKVRQNRVFKIALRPMNRVAAEALAEQIPLIRFESNPAQKAERIVDLYSRLILGCINDMELLEPVMAELNDLVDVSASTV
ncbi:MAG: motility associated factor glycosyltransferase family protein [Syntrophomonadaceae bacterium]|nr:motility associated factor glycosyltransferase family protein [Syntrophomonadaceae bacterium]